MDMSLVLVTLLSLVGLSRQDFCEECDCIISDISSDNQPGVHFSKLSCLEGSVTWYSPVGALRLEINPDDLKAFRMCFVMETRNARIKVSREMDTSINSKSPSARKSYILNDNNLTPLMTVQGRSQEYCITSEETVILYLEPEWSDDLSFQKVEFQYDIQKPTRTESLIEDCRPCSEPEILTAYCSSDFVVVGSMADVRNSDDSETTHIEVAVSQIIRQKGDNFRRLRREDSTLRGVISAPKKCGIVKGEGLFMMTGKHRLGELRLGCAPYLEEWEAAMRGADLEGTMECSWD